MLSPNNVKSQSPVRGRTVRVLYSFPFRIGAERICTTAWHQAAGAAVAGADVTVFTGSVGRPLPQRVRIHTSLALGRIRAPIRFLGRGNACDIHDRLTARWLERHAGEVDVVHGWPLSSLHTIRVAKRLGIPFFLERPNAHTAYAYEAAAEEGRRLGISLPPDHDHQFNTRYLAHEELEYAEADFLLCPSEFVAGTFEERGFDGKKLLRHHYGFDETRFTPGSQDPTEDRGLVMIYAGVCEPRKGLHYALEAWIESGAHERGKFLVCGEFVPGYAEKVSRMLKHPSVEVMGHRRDLPELMRRSDLFVLSSVEEGSALVTYEARGSGCVLLVSDGAGAPCKHMENSLVHPKRDLPALIGDIVLVDRDRKFLKRLREASLTTLDEITWTGAGKRLVDVYSSKFPDNVGLPG